MLPVFWILLWGVLHDGQGQNIRHGRTRYVSGKNQIYTSGYTFDEQTNNNNEIPFVHFWERPLQMLETSMNVRKKSSRPLFSWDVPVETTSYTTEEKISTKSEPSVTVNPSPVTVNPSEQSNYKNHTPSGLPLTTSQAYIKENEDGKKEYAIKRSSFLYLSSPTKMHKKFKINRKKSVNASLESLKNAEKWTKNGTKMGVLKKKKFRKIGRRKPVNQTNEAIGFKHTVGAVNLKRTSAFNRNLREKYNVMLVNGSRFQAHLPCNAMEQRCEHRCHMVNGNPTCICHKGFRSVGTKCVDINECEVNNGGCNGKCINTIGYRKCICSPGFRLVEGTCIDINECLLRNGHGPCQDKCTNTVGSYKCSCENLTGTKLSSDNHTCENMNECNPKKEGCSHSCVRTAGRTFCLCPDGFELGLDWKTCHDIDECSNPKDYDIACDGSQCVNTVGSYRCSVNNETNVLAY